MFHADPSRPVFNGRPLYYLERSMARWLGSQGAMIYLVPDPSEASGLSLDDVAADLDGLVLQGGVDVSPRTYGEEPKKPEWAGDAVRDTYEIVLVKAMVAAKKPVLGICRGHQLLNVAFGGTLHQDIVEEVEGALVHRDPKVYEKLQHDIAIDEGSWLGKLYPGTSRAKINSVHHQAIKALGKGVKVVARSTADDVIEAIDIEAPGYVRGVQWHPEFSYPVTDDLLDDTPMLRDFMDHCRAARSG